MKSFLLLPLFLFLNLAAPAIADPTPEPTAPAALPPGKASSLITAFRPAVRQIRNADSGLLHPGLDLTKAQLDTMQRHVRKGDQPWAAAFEPFAANERSSLEPRLYYEPEWTEILHGPAGKAGNYITVRMAKDGDVAFHQIIMWYITGNEAYRLNALKVIRNYYSITKVEPHWDSQIRWGISASKLCFVADLLRYSKGQTPESLWKQDDQARFGHLLEMGKGLISGPGYWMNQHGFSTMGLIGTAIVLDDRKLYEECVERTTVNSQGQPGGRNGSIKWQMRLVTENASTGQKVDSPQVQEVEMARDQGHAWIDPAALSLLAQIISNQGTRVDPVDGMASKKPNAVDVFSFLDDRLLAGTDYLTRFSLGEPVTWIPVVMSMGNPPQIGDQIKGAPRLASAGILYNHYKYLRKWDTNDPRFRAVAKVYESHIPEADGGTDFPGNGTLLYTPEEAFKP